VALALRMDTSVTLGQHDTPSLSFSQETPARPLQVAGSIGGLVFIAADTAITTGVV